MSESKSARRLGRGLEALLGPVSREQVVENDGSMRELAIDLIIPNHYQPRRVFDESALTELAESLRASGLLQPIVVRAKGAQYELIAGERRWRAAQRLGWSSIPAIVRELDDRTTLTLAMIENLQRDDLTPLDEAAGYQRLMEEFQLTATEVARVIGKDRSTVANTLRLLKLPVEIQELLQARKLSEGHGRALLSVTEPLKMLKLAREAMEQGWSVREMETRARGDLPGSSRPRMMKRPPVKPVSADARRVEEVLRRRLGTDVRITAKRRGRGLISISWYSNDDLARVLELILGKPFEG